MDINNITMIGRLTRETELSYSKNNNTPICKLSIANNYSKDKVNYIDVITFSNLAKITHEHLSKGQQICVTGALQQDSWENDKGDKITKYRIISNSIQFLSKPNGSNGNSQISNEALSDVTPENIFDDIPF